MLDSSLSSQYLIALAGALCAAAGLAFAAYCSRFAEPDRR